MASLTLTLLSGQNLPANDLNGKSDPYVVLMCGNMKFKSKCIKKTINPQWNETFTFNIFNPSADQVTLNCYDKDTFSADDLLGKCVFPVANLPRDRDHNLSIQLVGKKARGNLNVRVRANGFGVQQMMQGGGMMQGGMGMQQGGMMQGGMMGQPQMMQGGMMGQPQMMQGGMMQQGGMMGQGMMQGGMGMQGGMMDKKDMKKMQKKQKKEAKKMKKKMKTGKK